MNNNLNHRWNPRSKEVYGRKQRLEFSPKSRERLKQYFKKPVIFTLEVDVTFFNKVEVYPMLLTFNKPDPTFKIVKMGFEVAAATDEPCTLYHLERDIICEAKLINIDDVQIADSHYIYFGGDILNAAKEMYSLDGFDSVTTGTVHAYEYADREADRLAHAANKFFG